VKGPPLGEADAKMRENEPISKRAGVRAPARPYSCGTNFTAVP